MAQKYTRVPTDTFEKLQLNAGIMVDSFTPSTGTIGNILGATTGGINFTTNPEFTDFGEDIDNVPNNMMELKHLKWFAPKMAGTLLTVSPAVVKKLVGAADIGSDTTKVIPRAQLESTDFEEVWWIGDYSDVNTDGTNRSAGFIAIRMMNSLNTAGFQIQSEKDEKGKFAFEFEGHYSIEDQETVPFEIYVKSGSETPVPAVLIDKHYAEILTTGSITLTATTTPAGETVTWSSGSESVATVTSGGVVSGAGAGNTIITASATINGVTVTDTCTVKVTAPAGA